MNFKAILLLFLSFTGFHLLATEPAPPQITGQVMDATTNQPIEFATVSILSLPDSALVSGAITDEKGEFKIQVELGTYLARVQFVTFETKEISDIVVSKSSKKADLGIIIMVESRKQLDEVVVQAERTQMQLNLDKKVYNVGKDLSSLGGSASDILDNLPSVTVDVEGNVELRGSSSVRVLIDGKPSGLVGLSSTDALRQLQGNMIESVEIITNPSARYDAEGMAGIINIILKKEKSKGVNGSFQVNTGVPHNHGASVNMNFRQKWVNLFVNYGLDYRKAPGQGKGFQEFDLGDTLYTTDLTRRHDRGGISNNVRFGSDFYLNDKNTITAAFLYRYSDELNESRLEFEDYDQNGNLINTTRREDDETEGDENLEYSVNYTRSFTRKGQKLTADIQYQNNNELERSDITQFENGESELFQKVRNQEGEKRLMLQSDYIQPFAQRGKVEVGFRSTFRDIRNKYSVFERENEAQDFVELDTFSTDFAYTEDVHAFYGIVSNEFEKISWQVGLRSETTAINTTFRESGTQRNWNYTNLFPSAFLTYAMTDANQVQVSYSRRIRRPRFRDINPFSSFTDNRNFRVGNPELQPEFTDSYEVGYLQNFSNASIYYGVYFRNTTQNIQRVTLSPNDLGQRTSIPYNIGSSEALGIEINASNDFTEWYRVSGNFNFFRQETIGSVGDSLDLGAEAITFTTRVSNNFKLSKLFDAQLNVNYRAPQNQPQGRRLSITVVDLGITRDIWNNNGTLSLSARDLFNSRKWRSETRLENFYEESEWQWRRGPTFVLTLNYRLNQKKDRSGGRGDGDFDEGGGF